jgi:ABC-type proline/glycine betaine transport system permease subunit
MMARVLFWNWLVGMVATVAMIIVAIGLFALGDRAIEAQEVVFGSAFFGLVFGVPVGIFVGGLYALVRYVFDRKRKVRR